MPSRTISALLGALAILFPSAGRAERDQAVPGADTAVFRAQIFNNHMPDPTDLPQTGFVWGSAIPLNLPGIIDSYYYPNQRDLDRSHTAEWFKANHPSWITYQCDRNTPSYGYTYAWGAYVPIDTTNPDVRRYLLTTYFEPALAKGYRAIAFDNVTLLNGDKRCGVWRDGNWLQLFTGQPRERAHTAEKLDYIGWFAREIHKRGGLVALNAKIDPYQIEASRKLIKLADIWVDEGGFSDACRRRVTGDVWRLKYDFIQQRNNELYVSINYACAQSFPLDEAERSWIVASFLVSRNERSFLAVVPQNGTGRRWDDPNLNPPVGSPTGPAEIEGNLAKRSYDKGYVIVNFSAQDAVTISTPSGSWRDMFGGLIGASIELPPRSGAVLIQAH